jgi:hypothetical protein
MNPNLIRVLNLEGGAFITKESVCDAVEEAGGGGGSGGGDGGSGLPLTGGSLSGPLVIVTSTQPELHVADAAGVQTLDLNNSGLTLKDSSVGNSVRITLGQVLVQGSGAELGGSANRTTVGVNYFGLGHKSRAIPRSPSTKATRASFLSRIPPER